MSGQQTIKILLIEDDADDYRLVARQLRQQQYGFAITWAETLTAALTELERTPFDIVLTDLSLPDSMGLTTVARLREKCAHLPILVLTSLDDECVEQDILDAGAQDYLVKGELSGRAVARAILHAVQRQETHNEADTLLAKLQQSQLLLQQQADLLKRKNQRLRQYYKTAQEFVDNVSHDLRTPLSVIKDYVAIVREGMAGEINADQLSMLDKVTVRVDDLNHMVDDLLDISKVESGLLNVWRRNVRVGDIVEHAVSLLQERAQLKKVELGVEGEPHASDVYCDADKAVRVITNLAVNAIKFSGEGGTVRLWTRTDVDRCQVTIGVTDNGPGIDRDSLARLFQRFRQLDLYDKSTVKGFGLGLNIAQQLCRLNLGELNVESHVGQGSTFSFTLPMADPPEVLRRWLPLQGASGNWLRVIEISIGPDFPSDAADEFDHFLNCLLRSYDLLFRLAGNRWLLVIAAPAQEADRWFQRAEQEFRRHNRNRPLGPLPKYRATVRQEGNASQDAALILEQFELMTADAAAPLGTS